MLNCNKDLNFFIFFEVLVDYLELFVACYFCFVLVEINDVLKTLLAPVPFQYIIALHMYLLVFIVIMVSSFGPYDFQDFVLWDVQLHVIKSNYA